MPSPTEIKSQTINGGDLDAPASERVPAEMHPDIPKIEQAPRHSSDDLLSKKPITQDRLRQIRINLNKRGKGEGNHFGSVWEEEYEFMEDCKLSGMKDTEAWDIAPRVFNDWDVYLVVETNNSPKWLGNMEKDPGQLSFVYPGDVVVRKDAPISIWSIGVPAYETDAYFLESKLPFLSEATIEKYKHQEMIYVRKLNGGKNGPKCEEGYVPRACLEAVKSDNLKYEHAPIDLTEREAAIPRTCLE